MTATRKTAEQSKRRRPPATTPEARENQMVALAVEQAEKQMRAGTASSQVITHYLKLATTREKLEQEKLTRENKLLDARVEAIQAAARIEELYTEAIAAMRSYAPSRTDEDFED